MIYILNSLSFSISYPFFLSWSPKDKVTPLNLILFIFFSSHKLVWERRSILVGGKGSPLLVHLIFRTARSLLPQMLSYGIPCVPGRADSFFFFGKGIWTLTIINTFDVKNIDSLTLCNLFS